MKTTLIAAALALVLTPLGASAAALSGSDGVRDTLELAGYTDIREIEFSSGLWEANVRAGDGRWQEVYIDPANGEIFSAGSGADPLGAAAIASGLEAAGYRQIRDLDREGGIWEAEAIDPQGQPVDLRLAGTDGRILHSEVDVDDHDD